MDPDKHKRMEEQVEKLTKKQKEQNQVGAERGWSGKKQARAWGC